VQETCWSATASSEAGLLGDRGNVSRAVKDPHDFDAIDQRAIEDYVSTHREAAQFACQLLASAPHLRLRREEATRIRELIKQGVSRPNVIQSDVKPDFLQILLGAGCLGDAR
jgi:hypothetical protein